MIALVAHQGFARALTGIFPQQALVGAEQLRSSPRRTAR